LRSSTAATATAGLASTITTFTSDVSPSGSAKAKTVLRRVRLPRTKGLNRLQLPHSWRPTEGQREPTQLDRDDQCRHDPRIVDASPQPSDDQRDRDNTLGDLLFGKKAKAPVSEVVWVGLVQSIAAGDQRALHALYTRTHRIIFTLIMRIVSNRETAEELTVDVFHDVWRRAPTYDPAGGSVIGWIMNQARSRAIDRLRFEQRKKRVNHEADSLPPVTAGGPQEALDVA